MFSISGILDATNSHKFRTENNLKSIRKLENMQPHTNPKNQLQEFLVAQGIAGIDYQTKVVGGEPHCPVFQSTVKFKFSDLDRSGGSRFSGATGDKFNTKKKAEFSAAQKALRILKASEIHVHKPKPIKINRTSQVTLYIDLENRANIADSIIDILRTQSDIKIIGFASTTAPVWDKTFHKTIELIKVPSSHMNAADVGIIMKVTMDFFNAKSGEAIIATADKFGHALADCINNFSKLGADKDYRAICVSNLDQIVDALENLKNYDNFDIPRRY